MQVGKSTLAIDNADVRVATWTLNAGEHTGRHRHELDYVVIPLTDGTTRIAMDHDAIPISMSRGVPYFRERGAQHDLINEGERTLAFVEVELKRAAPTATGEA